MYITDSLVNFLNDSMILSNSTIVLTDLNKVVFVASTKDTGYLNKVLSDDLRKVLNLYIYDSTYVDCMNVSMNTIVPIVEDDDVSKYKSQIVLPIIHNDVVDRIINFYY